MNPMRRRIPALASLILSALLPLSAQEQKPHADMPGMSNPAPDVPAATPDTPSPEAEIPGTKTPETKTSGMNMNDAGKRDMAGTNTDGAAHAMRSMEDRQMSMGRT